MKTQRIGVIGSGYWGPNLIRNFVEIPNADMVAVADIDENRLELIKARYPQTKLTTNYHDLFDMGLDAVTVATPPATHFSITKDCLENGLHVLVEKPLTLNSQDAEKLIQIAKENDRIIMVGHTFEYNSAVHALKDIITSGEIGDVYYIDAARLSLGLFQKDSNVLWDLAPHDISILLFLLEQEPISVSALGMRCAINDVYDNVYMNIAFPNNVFAHVHVSWLDPCKVRRVTVVGSQKMVVYNDITANERIKVYDKGVDVPSFANGFGEYHFNYRHGDVLIPNVRFEEPLKKECLHFLESITENKPPRSNGEVGLRVIKVIEAAERSLLNGTGQELIQW